MGLRKGVAFIFVNGAYRLKRVIDVHDWITKDLKIAKPVITINEPNRLLARNLLIEYDCVYVSVFSGLRSKGTYLIIGLWRQDVEPLISKETAADPDVLGVPNVT